MQPQNPLIAIPRSGLGNMHWRFVADKIFVFFLIPCKIQFKKVEVGQRIRQHKRMEAHRGRVFQKMRTFGKTYEPRRTYKNLQVKHDPAARVGVVVEVLDAEERLEVLERGAAAGGDKEEVVRAVFHLQVVLAAGAPLVSGLIL